MVLKKIFDKPTIIVIICCVLFVSIVHIININNNEIDLYEEIKYESSRYNPTLKGYDSEKIKPQVYIIENNNNCDVLIKLFERNSEWWGKPMLADKIVRTCDI